ncbi:PAS domain S-box-containing protein [Singulisphaera sp. GP187]|uniref:PAS domain-containing hybrid sensor histidine kinase/response regulator n=1 Tax=Singulisphaera sp. GP187 TaxID=1882752 RepID=UPI000925D5D3|nr:ATP-binding protein [Singulisphaera sp. GP187]SIO60735.1 PAS domain S-box-containing protein [Singulisphaera sp. GP187]
MPMPQDVMQDFLAGGGEMGSLLRSFDWSKTPIGGVETWSPALGNMVRRLLANRFPLLLWWGPHYVQIYNDALRPILGARHPEAVGQPAADCWLENWAVLGPLIDTPFHGGPATWSEGLELALKRPGLGEEATLTIACRPVPDEDAPHGIGGILATVHQDAVPLGARFRRPIGDSRWAIDTAAPRVGSLLDITAQARKDEALRASEAKYRRLVEFSPVAMCACDSEGVITFYNDRAADIWGWSPRVGDRVHRFCGASKLSWPDGTPLLHDQTPMAQALRDGTPSRNRELVMEQPGGRRIHVLVNVDVVRDAGGRIVGAINVFLDVTDLKQAQLELCLAKESAEAANRSKDTFLANVSHEIRTPFGGILGMTELVLETPLTDDQRQCLTTVKAASESLLGLIDGLLDYSKIEAGKLELDPAEFSLRAVLSETMRTLLARAHEKGLGLSCDVRPGVPNALVGDAGRLRQVLLNLVGNAIKFTKQGRVEVRVEPLAEGAEAGGETVLRFAVTDTGIGIPADGQERIFQAFEQEDGSTTRQYGGTGLGLTIAAGLVGLMGGTIHVQSEPGQGSTFAFTARFGDRSRSAEPIQDVASPPNGATSRPGETVPAPAPTNPPLRILVAEDSEFNSRHLIRLLNRRGHVVRLATDGREALDLLGIEGQGASHERPLAPPEFDILLLDLYMPNLDGFQVVRAIREREKYAEGHLPVIALTARARQEDREHCLAAGMDEYIAKPIRAEELFAAIDRIVVANGAHRDDR